MEEYNPNITLYYLFHECQATIYRELEGAERYVLNSIPHFSPAYAESFRQGYFAGKKYAVLVVECMIRELSKEISQKMEFMDIFHKSLPPHKQPLTHATKSIPLHPTFQWPIIREKFHRIREMMRNKFEKILEYWWAMENHRLSTLTKFPSISQGWMSAAISTVQSLATDEYLHLSWNDGKRGIDHPLFTFIPFGPTLEEHLMGFEKYFDDFSDRIDDYIRNFADNTLMPPQNPTLQEEREMDDEYRFMGQSEYDSSDIIEKMRKNLARKWRKGSGEFGTDFVLSA
jgi:hypothetical protein